MRKCGLDKPLLVAYNMNCDSTQGNEKTTDSGTAKLPVECGLEAADVFDRGKLCGQT